MAGQSSRGPERRRRLPVHPRHLSRARLGRTGNRYAVRLHPEEIQDYITEAQKPDQCTAANYCQHVNGSDTIYITLPARYLPLYQPFVDLGDATGTSGLIVPVTDFLSPFTQTIIETGYDRTNYANPQPGTILPPKTFNPIKTAVDLVNDIPEGINMALTPGRTPLPGRRQYPPTTMPPCRTPARTNMTVAKSTPKLGTPDLRLGIFAKPGETATSGRRWSERQSSAAEGTEGLPPGSRRRQGGLGHGEEGARQGRQLLRGRRRLGGLTAKRNSCRESSRRLLLEFRFARAKLVKGRTSERH